MILYRGYSEPECVIIGPPDEPITVAIGDVIDSGFDVDMSVVAATIDSAGKFVLDLSDFFDCDRTLDITAYDDAGAVIFEEQVEIVRPYALPGKDDRPSDFFKRESRARKVIDGETGGFYLSRKTIHRESLGGDIIPLRDRVVQIFRVWENGSKVFDVYDDNYRKKIFAVTRDGSGIVLFPESATNRIHGKPTGQTWAPSDYLYPTMDSVDGTYPKRRGVFPEGHDYVLDVLVGYRFLPSDITLATELLMESGVCTDQYMQRYIKEYDTDQYRIKYDGRVFEGTGVLEVDRILRKYIDTSGRLFGGVL